jgi:hypothetical protein
MPGAILAPWSFSSVELAQEQWGRFSFCRTVPWYFRTNFCGILRKFCGWGRAFFAGAGVAWYDGSDGSNSRQPHFEFITQKG